MGYDGLWELENEWNVFANNLFSLFMIRRTALFNIHLVGNVLEGSLYEILCVILIADSNCCFAEQACEKT